MWIRIAGIILRYRITILAFIVLVTGFFAYKALDARIAYSYAQMLPEDDSTFVQHKYFKQIFGEEANVFVIGVEDTAFFTKEQFNDYLELAQTIKKQYGISEVVSVGQVVNLKKNDSLQSFEFLKLFPPKVSSQAELDSLVTVFRSLKFYEGLIYSDSSKAYLLAISLDKELLNTKERIGIIDNIHSIADTFAQKHNVKFHYSGMPYIRTEISKKVKAELNMFIILAFIVTALFIYLFFHSFKAVFFSLLIVGIGVVWSIGSLVLFNFEITILTGMIPPVLIIIGVENSIYILNRYHSEYKRHGNKIKALQRVISKVGNAIFLTNLTTAAGFATFILTSSTILVEFGLVASINIIALFLIAITLIPIIFSFIDPPKRKHVKHLDKKWTQNFINKIEHIALNHRTKVYIVVVLVVIAAFYGMSKVHTTGFMVDDIPQDDPIYVDLKFFEKNFNGVLPIEILIDTKEPNGAFKLENIKKLDALQDSLSKYPELSRGYSLAEAAKFLRQAYYGGDPRRYRIPIESERVQIAKYLKTDQKQKNFLTTFLDSSYQITRLSVQSQDIGTKRMAELTKNIEKDINSIFSEDKYYTIKTGASIVFSRGTEYLIKNLFSSIAIAIFLISLVMSYMFYSWRMVLVSITPNIIPQIITAGLMGYFDIPIKPSTILVFSIAFGISVDSTIHFLSRYRQELRLNKQDVTKAVTNATREAGVSMMYTGIVLFFGFAIFAASEFGGTKALGILVSITLLFAVALNLTLLPSLLLTFKKTATSKAFQESEDDVFSDDSEVQESVEIKISSGQSTQFNVTKDEHDTK